MNKRAYLREIQRQRANHDQVVMAIIAETLLDIKELMSPDPFTSELIKDLNDETSRETTRV